MQEPSPGDHDEYADCRQRFEGWISGEPYVKSIDRIPDEPEKFAWAGSYRDINTDLAWQAWQFAWAAAMYQSSVNSAQGLNE